MTGPFDPPADYDGGPFTDQWQREPEPRQDADGTAHLVYFDTRTQASFRWDGRSDVIEVGIGGYGEPVDHTIPAPWAPHDPRRADVLWFGEVARSHADSLPTYGEEEVR